MKWMAWILMCVVGAVVAGLLIYKNCPAILLYGWGVLVGGFAQSITLYE